jgi:acyl-CoA synthetase (AMP-forming)/AMP-acid ligase II
VSTDRFGFMRAAPDRHSVAAPLPALRAQPPASDNSSALLLLLLLGCPYAGDVASIDRFGYMRIQDRSKDVVKSGGEWISSIALENAAMGHPKVSAG